MKAGSAAFSVAIILTSPEPVLVLGLLGIIFLVVGGTTWTRGGQGALPSRLLVSFAAVVLARIAFGTLGALFAAVIEALGAWLRVRLADAVMGLAVFGLVIAFLGAASARLVLVFWAMGLAIIVLRHLAVSLWRHVSARRSLTPERTKAAALGAEN